MLAIEVEYLLGRAVATDTNRRDRGEWPPHPTRLFSALVDALSDVGGEKRSCGEAALRWIEREPPPEIAVSLAREVSHRTIVKHFVPINDEPVGAKSGPFAVINDRRSRQERFFPAVVPGDPRVIFVWPGSEPHEDHFVALADLATRVPYLGHSSSVVRVSCRREAPPRTLAPAMAGDYLLRVPGPGRFDRLQAVHELRKEDTYVQPPRGKEIPYDRVGGRPAVQGPYGAIRVLGFEGARFGLTETAWITERLRAAVLSKLSNMSQIPEALSGHALNGAPSTRPHIAFVPFGNVGWAHADGGIKGAAVLVPVGTDEATMVLLDAALSKIARLMFGERGVVTVVPQADDLEEHDHAKRSLASLAKDRYERPSKTWASVTPVALGHHAKPKKGLTEEAILVRHVCELGLPTPSSIVLRNVSDVRGAPPARMFQRGQISSVVSRQLRHAVIRFPERVAGPLVIGAGRHMGFGLFMAGDEAA